MIKIANRTDTYQVKSRIVPFRISVYNGNDTVVASRDFTEVQDSYTWDKVNVYGTRVRIELTNNNYLHMTEVEVWGEEAQDCNTYLERYQSLDQTIQSNLLKKSKTSKEMEMNRDLYKRLYDSCRQLDPVNQEKRQELVTEQAKAYDSMIQRQKEAHDKLKAQAQRKLAEVNRRLAEEKKSAEEAKKLGLPPPPSWYTPAQVEQAKKEVSEFKVKALTEEEKAKCMILLTEANTAKVKADDMGRMSEAMKFLLPSAEKATQTAEELVTRYNRECLGIDSSDLIMPGSETEQQIDEEEEM